MSTSGRLVSNTVIVIVGTAAQRLLQFATTVLLARSLGDEQFGTYSFVVAYMFMFGFIVDLGFERVITREVSRHPEQTGELIGTGFIARGVLSVLAAVAAVGIAWLVGLPRLTQLCILIAAIGMPLSIEILVRGFFQSRFEMHYPYLLTLPGNVAFMLLAATVIRLGGGLPGVMGASLATGVLSVALLLVVALPKMKVVWRLNGELLRYLWRESWELGAVILLFLVTMRIDQVLLYWLRSAGDVAQYAVAVKVTEAFNLIPESVMVTVFPLLAATEHSAPERFERIYHFTVRYLIAFVAPVALALTLERRAVILALFGADYVPGAPALVLMAWWMFFSYTGAVYLNLMIVRSQQRVIGVVSAFALIVNVLLNLAWIPSWGAAGSAAAILVSSATSFTLFAIIPQTRATLRVCCTEAVRPLAAIGVTAGVLWLVTSPTLRLGLLPVIYIAVLFAIGGIRPRDFQWVESLWQPAHPRA